ncbi:hypothetical protein VRB67_04635 [Pseudomonas trivialis]|uniref:hypothetical protein n=1 Tax=Pseudomonas trivialis TaxID=200450 RepID=UPI0030CD4435
MNKPGLVPGLFFGARANASQLSERHAQGNEDQLWELACLRRRFFGVPIRFCGNGCWRFRPDYGSLWKSLRSASVFDGAPPIKIKSAAALEPTGMVCRTLYI